MSITFTKTHYVARIHRFDDEPIVLCEEMLSCSIARTLENPAHSFSLNVIGVGDYYKDNEIKSDDWIEIFVVVSNSFYGKTVDIPVTLYDKSEIVLSCQRRFLGTIDRFTRSVEIKDGTPVVRFNISGSSWGKTIVKQPSIILPYFEGGIIMTKFVESKYKITDTPDKNIMKLLDHFWANEQFEIPDSLANTFNAIKKIRVYDEKIGNLYSSKEISSNFTIYDITTFDISACDGEVADSQMLTANTQMFQLLQQYKNPLLNEFWCDLTEDGEPRIVFREYPYTEQNLEISLKTKFRNYFDELEKVEVEGDNWQSLNVGRSGHERFNWYVVTSQAHPMGSIINQQAELYQKAIVKSDEKSIRRYGLLRYEQGTMYSSYLTDGGKPSTSFDTLFDFTKLVRNWFEQNQNFLSGTIQLKNVFDLLLGKRLIIHDIPTNSGGPKRHSEAYYVTAVTETWQVYSNANFEATITRGRVIDELGIVGAIAGGILS